MLHRVLIQADPSALSHVSVITKISRSNRSTSESSLREATQFYVGIRSRSHSGRNFARKKKNRKILLIRPIQLRSRGPLTLLPRPSGRARGSRRPPQMGLERAAQPNGRNDHRQSSRYLSTASLSDWQEGDLESASIHRRSFCREIASINETMSSFRSPIRSLLNVNSKCEQPPSLRILPFFVFALSFIIPALYSLSVWVRY
jgi:hypothetical protein